MPRLTVTDLKLTNDRGYWPSLAAPNLNGACFESRANAEAEDGDRVRSLLNASKLRPAELNLMETRKLAKRLAYKQRGKKPPRSMASSLYMRARRNAQFSQLWQLADGDASVAAFTVIKRGWEYAFASLLDADPRPLLKAFLSDLNRRGVAQADGWLIAWIHGEYEIPTNIFRLHIHGVSSGGMTGVVSGLRTARNYRSTRKKPRTDPVYQRVKIYRNLDHLPYPLTYACKGYWPLKVIVQTAEGPKRSRDHRRIPEPQHSQVLLWLNKWLLNDISLMVGMYVSPHGFRLTNSKTRGHR